MSLCRLLCLDFMDQTGRYDEAGAERYDDGDLHIGVHYAQWLLEDGYLTEPFYGFDLVAFRSWCTTQLLSPTSHPRSSGGPRSHG